MMKVTVTLDGQDYTVALRRNPANRAEFVAVVDERPAVDSADGSVEEILVYLPDAESYPPEWMVVGGRSYEVQIDNNLHWIQTLDGRHRLIVRDQAIAVAPPPSGDGRIKAPIPGLITRVMVETGQMVKIGQPLLILEAMKMENEIRAPCAGVIQQVSVTPGQSVALDVLLVEIV